ncbi:MAG: GTPase HflX, partial [Christensenellaceae bacterium]|nr:GTPase HflX [Christensenellaceae bacterium]
MINGNISGIRDSVLEQLEQLYEMKLQKDEFVSMEMAELLAMHSGKLNREISVYVSRSGRVLDVSVGGSADVSMPYIRKRRGTLGLSGVRCIHT